MHTTISYKGRPRREAMLDWCQWLGFRRARIMAREARRGCTWREFDILCCFAGVSGFPNIAAYEHFAGRELTDADWED